MAIHFSAWADEGKLVIYLTVLPDPGTHRVLVRAAQQLQAQGRDVWLALDTFDPAVILTHHPDVVVVGDLAHRNGPGSYRAARYLEIQRLLEAGINVVTDVDALHIAAFQEQLERLTGNRMRHAVPDSILADADQLFFYDLPSEVIAKKLRGESPLFLVNEEGSDTHSLPLTAKAIATLRALAMRTVAGYAQKSGEKSPVMVTGATVQEKILVCLGHPKRSNLLLECGRRMALRTAGELYALMVLPETADNLSDTDLRRLQQTRAQLQPGETLLTEPARGRTLGRVIADVVKREGITQVIVGQPEHGKTLRHSPVPYLVRSLRDVDMRIVGWQRHSQPPQPPQTAPTVQRPSGKLILYAGVAQGDTVLRYMLEDAKRWSSEGLQICTAPMYRTGSALSAFAACFSQMSAVAVREDPTAQEKGWIDEAAATAHPPDAVLIDMLPHQEEPSEAMTARYEQVIHLLDQGVNVVAAVSLAQLASISGDVDTLAHMCANNPIPDWLVARAQEMKVIDAPLQEWLETTEKGADQLPTPEEQPAGWAALRQIALQRASEFAASADAALDQATDTDEKTLVCISEEMLDEGPRLLRRGYRISTRKGLKMHVLVGVHKPLNQIDAEKGEALQHLRSLAVNLGATFEVQQATGGGCDQLFVHAACQQGVTQIVLSHAAAQGHWLRHTIADALLAGADFADLHLVAGLPQPTPQPVEEPVLTTLRLST
ncbi:MAG: hypothetical protein IMW91_00705 [Firmicutes bacterium]|nr:hypothetical protein [Bacillota bacterium]